MNRRTSVYTLRVNPAQADAIPTLRTLIQASYPITDEGGTTLSFRAPGDQEAIQAASDAIDAYDTASDGTEALRAQLTTGLGVHRRTIAQEN